jgi:hypothetical protein
MATLRLKPPVSVKQEAAPQRSSEPLPAPAKPVVIPVFDPEMLAVETYGDGGIGFIQGKNYFTRGGAFVRELPEAQWYLTTPEMERNNKIARAKWRAVTRGSAQAQRAANVPDKLVQISRENARVLAAEALAE